LNPKPWFLESNGKNGAMGFFSDHKSSSAQIIPPEPDRTCKLMRMTGSKKYSTVGSKPSRVWGSIYYQRKITLHHFLSLDSRNQESALIPGFWNPMIKNGAM
jgi:hypothetical protein